MDFYLYSAFLVLTTQSSLQYSFTFTQSHTHSYSASISSTLLFYEGQFAVQDLAQGHFGMQILGRLGIKLPTFRLEDEHSTPSATAALFTVNSGTMFSLFIVCPGTWGDCAQTKIWDVPVPATQCPQLPGHASVSMQIYKPIWHHISKVYYTSFKQISG